MSRACSAVIGGKRLAVDLKTVASCASPGQSSIFSSIPLPSPPLHSQLQPNGCPFKGRTVNISLLSPHFCPFASLLINVKTHTMAHG
jgi:hypothetical protein